MSQDVLPNLDLRDAAAVIDAFDRAAAASLGSTLRRGSAIHLPATGRLLVAGDLHDHGLNFQRLVKLAALDSGEDHRLVLHEIVHGRRLINGMDLSVRLLARIASLQAALPSQVFVMLGNHELSQFQGTGILKNSTNVVELFNQGVEFLYADEAPRVSEAMNRYLRSLALAIRCANGVFVSHSLPSPRMMETFDPAIVDRLPTEADLAMNGSAYQLVWGRKQSQEVADDLGDEWDADLFLMGHQPADMGHERLGRNMLVLASDHEHGVGLPVDLTREHDMDELIEKLVPLGGVEV